MVLTRGMHKLRAPLCEVDSQPNNLKGNMKPVRAKANKNLKSQRRHNQSIENTKMDQIPENSVIDEVSPHSRIHDQNIMTERNFIELENELARKYTPALAKEAIESTKILILEARKKTINSSKSAREECEENNDRVRHSILVKEIPPQHEHVYDTEFCDDEPNITDEDKVGMPSDESSSIDEDKVDTNCDESSSIDGDKVDTTCDESCSIDGDKVDTSCDESSSIDEDKVDTTCDESSSIDEVDVQNLDIEDSLHNEESASESEVEYPHCHHKIFKLHQRATDVSRRTLAEGFNLNRQAEKCLKTLVSKDSARTDWAFDITGKMLMSLEKEMLNLNSLKTDVAKFMNERQEEHYS